MFIIGTCTPIRTFNAHVSTCIICCFHILLIISVIFRKADRARCSELKDALRLFIDDYILLKVQKNYRIQASERLQTELQVDFNDDWSMKRFACKIAGKESNRTIVIRIRIYFYME